MADAAFRAGSAAFERGDLPAAHADFARLVRLAPNVGAAHSAFGAVLLAEGNPRTALVELQRARELDPADLRATINLGQAYFLLHRFPESVATFRLVPEISPGGTPTLTAEETLSYASALAATGDNVAAQHQIASALASDPASAALHDTLGTLLIQMQHTDEADAEFHKAIALNPALALPHFHLGSLSLIENRSGEAVAELTAAVHREPANAGFLIQLGRALTADGQDAEAINVLRRAQALEPNSVDAKYALALALQSGGSPKEAIPLFGSVVTARPSDWSALTNEALALVQTGEAQRAILLYQKALAGGGDNSTLREDLGAAHLQLNQVDQAVEQFQAGLALDPANPHLRYDLGLALKLKDKPEDAVREFVEAERIDPDLPDPPYTLGVLEMQLGHFPEAQVQLEKAAALRGENGEVWALLGNVYKQTGDPEKAKSALAHASSLLPDQPGPHISLAALLAQEGNTSGAAAERRIAADLSRVAYARQRATFALESGRALLKKNDLPAAVTQLQAAIAADSTLPEPHLLLADALSQQHKPADAAIERKKAQDLARNPATTAILPAK